MVLGLVPSAFARAEAAQPLDAPMQFVLVHGDAGYCRADGTCEAAVDPRGGSALGGAGVVMTGAGDNSAFALRASAAYYVEVGGVALGPAVSLDHANGENALVYGVSAGKGF